MKKNNSPWYWVPSLYFAEGLPYVVVMTISVILYKRMGISNTDIALYTSWLYLPWVIKPLWSPFVDILKTKRFWIVLMQLLIGAGLASIALSIPVPKFFQLTLAFFWLLAFSSATHDIAADGFYMLGLTQHQQAWFVGVRSTFYRLAMLMGQGLLVILAGTIESETGLENLNLPVKATTKNVEQVMLFPDSMGIQPMEGELSILHYPKSLHIPIQKQNPDNVNKLIKSAREWNQKQGQLYPQQTNGKKTTKDKSVWDQWIGNHLEKCFLAVFGPRHETEPTKVAGNTGVIYFFLSKPPGKKITVNFGRESGDKSISLVEGTRFEFTDQNWNKPVMSVIQLDSKLKSPAQAQFVARAGNIRFAWMITFFVMSALFFIFAIFHKFALPKPPRDIPRPIENVKSFLKQFYKTFHVFFKKKYIGVSVVFLLIFRLGESQLVKLASPFLLDSQEAGGLALTTEQVGFVYGTVGLLMLTLGGLLGGFVAAKHGLKKWIWWMALAIKAPDIVYVYLSNVQPDSFVLVNICVGIEQFGYGFGFTAYMLYMIYISEGEFKTAHYAIATGFMALGMMIPGMFSGWIQELIGYSDFFIWVLLSAIPGFLVIKYLKIDPEFGKKNNN